MSSISMNPRLSNLSPTMTPMNPGSSRGFPGLIDIYRQQDIINRREKVNTPFNKIVQWQLDTGQLDHWTSYHIAAGIFIAKIAEWLGATDFWCVMWVVIIGIAWEIFEYIIEDWRVYGSKKKWAYNTAADLIVEIGAAWWIMI